jgi:hypothetical protein
MRLSACLAVASLFSVVSLGCNSSPSNNPPTERATVKVTLKGAPLEGATVTFAPSSESGKAAVGTTDATGTAVLGTFEAADGAIAGTYKVAVAKAAASGSSGGLSNDQYAKMMEKSAASKGKAESSSDGGVPSKYQDANTSGLVADVLEGQENNFTFDLQ